METENKTAPLKAEGLFINDLNSLDVSDRQCDCATLGLGAKVFQARRERTIGIGIELALRTPEEEEPMDYCRSRTVTRSWSLNAKSSGEVAASNAERERPNISWQRQAASFASFQSACFWQC